MGEDEIMAERMLKIGMFDLDRSFVSRYLRGWKEGVTPTPKYGFEH